jgi:tetratricopeptide (TPR) repeat protein
MAEQIAQALVDLLQAECAAHPLLLVLDDLQWGDATSVQLVQRVLQTLTDQPLMILALARPEVETIFPSLWGGQAQLLPLRPLSKRASERLVQQVLGKTTPAAVVSRIVEHAAGHALLLEELVRAVAEGRGDATPESVLAILQGRIGRLEPMLRRVLLAASVYGLTFRCAGVKAILGSTLGSIGVERFLDKLVAEEFLSARSDQQVLEPEDREFAFRHNLVLDAAYGLLGADERVAAHRRAGEYLERASLQDPLTLASHYERGGELVRAGRFYALAAGRAHSISDTDTAVALADRGLKFPLPDGVRSTLLARLTECHAWRGDYARAVAPAEEAIRLAVPGSGPWFSVIALRASSAMLVRQVDVVMQLVEKLQEAEIAPDSINEAAFALRSVVDTLFLLGESERASVHSQRLAQLADAVGEREPLVAAWSAITQAIDQSWRCEEPESAVRWSSLAGMRFERLGHQRGMLFAKIYAGMNLWALGDLEQAEQRLRETLFVGAEFGRVSARRHSYITEAMLDAGRSQEALTFAQETLASAQKRGRLWDEAIAQWALADVQCRLGELTNAERAARRSCELLHASPSLLVVAEDLLAAITLRAGRTQEALARSQQVLARFAEMKGFGWKLALARLNHVRCLLATGQSEAARAALREALVSLQARAEKISDARLRSSFLQRVPEHAQTQTLAVELGLTR